MGVMRITTEQRARLYALVGDTDTEHCGRVFAVKDKRWAADQVVAAFEELVAETGKRPGYFDLRARARLNLQTGKVFGPTGEPIQGSIILTAILMALIGWVTRLVLDWLWENYTAGLAGA
jgi:hypothetical protein